MKFSENWLREFVNPALDSAELGHVLTMAGLEVEALEPVAPIFSQVVVAQILSAEKHPDADRLQVVRVDVGQSQPLQIVCGASNARAGLKAPCALVGAKLPGFDIKQAKVRGVESFGMMCSAKEIGLAEEATGLLELSDNASVGQDILTYFDLNDKVFELKLTPNRSDCLSVLGVARDVAALTNSEIYLPEVITAAVSNTQQKLVRVQAQEACPRYCGRVISIVNAAAPTPDWIIRRLERSGLRSISSIVDITNYVLLEMGQPLHAFDLGKLSGDIQVRYAKDKEKLNLLNEQEVELQADMLVIGDDNGAVALAGIMGGSATAVSDTTTDIFLESAFFAPSAITGRARRLSISTDSSYRFERGVDFAATRMNLERATQLILDICSGNAGEITEVTGQLPSRAQVKLRVSQVVAVLGIAFSQDAIAELLTRLQFTFTSKDGEFLVTPPSYRFDLTLEEDLIEEVVRLHGYEQLPAIAPDSSLNMLPDAESVRGLSSLRQALVAADYFEAITYSFVDAAWEKDLTSNSDPITLRNPIASNMSVMRSSLMGGLLNALNYNLNRNQSRVRLFEIGACFSKTGHEGYTQHTRIAGICYGDALPEQWGDAARRVDFYDVKADVEKLVGTNARFVAAQHPALHPGQSASIWLGDAEVGVVGTLHPRWQQEYDLPQSAVLFELDVAVLLSVPVPVFTEVPKFPSIRRDLAVLVDESVTFQAMLDAMRKAANSVVVDIGLFDIYRGQGIEKGKKSLAFLVLMQDTQKTLTDQDADSAMQGLIETLRQQFGAILRS